MLPLRTVALQALFLLIAIAIEATVLHRQLRLSPREGVQYAATINLFSTVLGWVTVFTLLDTGIGQQFNFGLGIQVALLNFILFNQLTPQSASSVVLLAFITFLASFVVKQFGLVLLKWVLDPKLAEVAPSPDPEERSVMRDPRKLIRQEASPQVFAVLVANALSYSAIGAVLMLLLLIQNAAAR